MKIRLIFSEKWEPEQIGKLCAESGIVLPADNGVIRTEDAMKATNAEVSIGNLGYFVDVDMTKMGEMKDQFLFQALSIGNVVSESTGISVHRVNTDDIDLRRYDKDRRVLQTFKVDPHN